MYRVNFYCPPKEGYEVYLPYFLRDSGVKIKHVEIWDRVKSYSTELAAFVTDEDALYLFLKYPDIRDQFHQF